MQLALAILLSLTASPGDDRCLGDAGSDRDRLVRVTRESKRMISELYGRTWLADSARVCVGLEAIDSADERFLRRKLDRTRTEQRLAWTRAVSGERDVAVAPLHFEDDDRLGRYSEACHTIYLSARAYLANDEDFNVIVAHELVHAFR